MRRIFVPLFALLLAAPAISFAQGLDSLDIQFHGYATQSFLYTNVNNWNTTDSSSGSAAWTEAVVNLTSVPSPKLRVGVQGRYLLLGSTGNTISLDWAQADYKVNEKFGFRVGKVKTPTGLLNETQDIDPAHVWCLLPSSIYAISNRGSILAHFGGVTYGAVPIGEKGGRVDYRGYGGQRVLAATEALFLSLNDLGIGVPNGLTGPMYGGALRYHTPIPGLMVGASEDSEHVQGPITLATFSGTLYGSHFLQPSFFSQYDRKRLLVAGEYTRQALKNTLAFTNGPTIIAPRDQRDWYAMATYKVVNKLMAGTYYSSLMDLAEAQSTSRFQKDWAFSGRFDATPYLYLKAEEHLIDGTYIGFYTSSNPAGLQPRTKMTLLKAGVSF